MAAERERLLFKAQMAEPIGRFDEMSGTMEQLVMLCEKHGMELVELERQLLSVAFKNAVESKRAARRVMLVAEKREAARGRLIYSQIAAEYRKHIDDEIVECCQRVLSIFSRLLDESSALSILAREDRAVCFILKMKGDYHRYIAELNREEDGIRRHEASEAARDAYQRATDFAKKGCSLSDPVGLGLALNYSVCVYELLNDPVQACEMTQETLQSVAPIIDQCEPEASVIVSMLRDNLELWLQTLENSNQDANPPVVR